VQDRDRELGSARVVGPDVDHRVRVGSRLVGVLLLDRAVPVAVVGGRGVVEVEVLDRLVADLLAVKRLFDLLDDGVRLLRVGALARQARIDVDLGGARALLVGTSGGGPPTCGSAAARTRSGATAARAPPRDAPNANGPQVT